METTFIVGGDSPAWKIEPESPPPAWGNELLTEVELWGEDLALKEEDPWSNDEWVTNLNSPDGETLSSGEEILDDIDGIIRSEEWTEGLYDNSYNVTNVWDCYKNITQIGVKHESPQPMIPDQTDLLREFEDVLTQTTGSLTPPESPKEQAFINILDEINPVSEIDQLVASEAEKQQISLQSLSPWSSPSQQSDSGYDDPDWSPGEWSPDQQQEPKRRKTTSTEERKLRKKEQNKNAATRYRQKKKQEMDVIMGEEKGLQDENDRLKADITEITREIRYLKSLMKDVFKAKGLIR